VDWALDEHNRALVTPEMEQRIIQARAAIISGAVKVPEYGAP
jgi:basic membrane protein A